MALLIPGFRGTAHLVGVLLGTLAGGISSPGATASSRQYELEAVLLFNLARFVDWPPESFSTTNAPLVLGIFGLDPFGSSLDSLVQGEAVNGHKIEVRRCSKIDEASRCHILFISAAEKSKIGRIIAALKGLPILTVSDLEGFCRRNGGMVAFYVNEQNKIRLRLNLDAARFSGLQVSAKLIQVAELEKTGFLRRNWTPAELPFLSSGIFQRSVYTARTAATPGPPDASAACGTAALTIVRRIRSLTPEGIVMGA